MRRYWITELHAVIDDSKRSQKKEKLKTTRERYFTCLPGRPHWDDCFEFWHAGDVADVIKFCDSRLTGFGVLIPPDFIIFHKLSLSPLQHCIVSRYRATL